MIIYLTVFIASVLIIHCTETYRMYRGEKIALVFLAVLLPSLLAGLRSYEIGSDTSGYGVYWFDQAVRFKNWFSFIKYAKGYSIDYGYATLNFLASRLGHDAHIFFFILCFLELCALYQIAKQNCPKGAISVSFMVYFLLYFNESMNTMRQFPAILIVLYSYRFIKEKKVIPFLLCVILAMQFHVTAIFAVVLYPIAWLARNRFSKLNLLLITIGILIASFSFEFAFRILGTFGFNLLRYEHYINSTEGGGKFIRLILFGGIWLFYMLNKDSYRKIKKDEANVFLFYSTISLAFTSLMFLGLSNFIIRMSYYFDFFVMIYLPSIAKMHKTITIKNGRAHVGVNFVAIMALLLFYWSITYVIRNGAETVPYKFFWS